MNRDHLMSLFGLEGRTAVVTGGGSGIGRATAVQFARSGARVVVSDIDLDSARETQRQIEDVGGESLSLGCDVASTASLQEMFRIVDDKFGVIDALFSNAGATAPVGLDATEDEWVRAIDVNMKSGYFAAKLARPLLERSGSASVVLNASISGLVAAPSVCYSMAKGGVVMLARSLAVLLAPSNIRVNVICPGPIETPTLVDSVSRQGNPDRVFASIVSKVPMARLGTPDELASVALFLASDAARYVTGAVIPVDGGYTAQ